jgi:hypothetical protein
MFRAAGKQRGEQGGGSFAVFFLKSGMYFRLFGNGAMFLGRHRAEKSSNAAINGQFECQKK